MYGEAALAELMSPVMNWLSKYGILVVLGSFALLETIVNIEQYFGSSSLLHTVSLIVAAIAASTLGAM